MSFLASLFLGVWLDPPVVLLMGLTSALFVVIMIIITRTCELWEVTFCSISHEVLMCSDIWLLIVVAFKTTSNGIVGQVRSGMGPYAGAAHRRVHLATVLLRSYR